MLRHLVVINKGGRAPSSSWSSCRRRCIVEASRRAYYDHNNTVINNNAHRLTHHWASVRPSLPSSVSSWSSMPEPTMATMTTSSHRFCDRRCQSTAAAATAAANEEEEEKHHAKNDATNEPEFVPTPERKYRYFRNVEITPSGVAMIRFDSWNKSVNALSFAAKDEAKLLWQNEIVKYDQENKDGTPIRAIVFSSAKPDMFIAGADIYDLKNTQDKSELITVIRDTFELFQTMRATGKPLVSAIHGPALGGGLEWALWTDYRICSDSSKTKLGLPEVKLGLLPGFGGTQNLPRLVGLQAAMDMMLTGKELRPDRAKKLGLVDVVVAPQSVEAVAIQSALDLANGTLKRPSTPRKSKSYLNWFLEDTSWGRRIVWDQIHKMVQKNTNGNYPAPWKIIESVKHGLEHPSSKYERERELFAELAATPESEALIGIFEGMTLMKKHSLGDDAARKVDTVAVMGAGLMGAGIAQVSAEERGGGLNVLLKDRDDASIARGQSYMNDNWRKQLQRKRLTQYQYNVQTSRVTPLTDGVDSWRHHFARADMVIEAVFEDLDLKRRIVSMVEDVTSDRTIFATNTSAIPIADIAVGARRPENIVGMHYFSPVPAMPLLEIIPHDGTSDEAKATAFEVGTKRQGKTCIFVKDVPGFYVNRCLGPLLVEVAALIQDGTPLDVIDRAMTSFGMPVGPITLADEVGIDVVSHVATFLSKADLGARMTGGDISVMAGMVEKGWLGKKSGKGFYLHDQKKRGGSGSSGKKVVNPEVAAYLKPFVKREALQLSESDVQDRIVSRFVNEAAKCWEDDIIADPIVGDIGLVFGTGFPPFRGGPFRHVDQTGVQKFVDKMKELADRYDGPQFEPCQLLQDYANANRKFHS